MFVFLLEAPNVRKTFGKCLSENVRETLGKRCAVHGKRWENVGNTLGKRRWMLAQGGTRRCRAETLTALGGHVSENVGKTSGTRQEHVGKTLGNRCRKRGENVAKNVGRPF